MASPSIRPRMLVADEQGNIYDHPDFLLMCRRGEEWSLPRPDELMPLPDESELFLLPGRRAVGLNPETGETEVMEDWAVAAFAAPAHTLTAHPVYVICLKRARSMHHVSSLLMRLMQLPDNVVLEWVVDMMKESRL